MTVLPILLLSIFGPRSVQRDFSKTWADVSQAIESRFYDRKARHDEMVRLLSETAPRAKAATTEAEFGSVVNDMIGKFKASHFGFFTKSDQEYYVMEGLLKGDKGGTDIPLIGAFFTQVHNGYLLSMLFENGSAEKGGLRKGDIVELVDGQPFTPIDSLRPKIGQTVSLVAKRGDAAITRQVEVDHGTMLDAFLEASRSSARKVGPGGRFGYFHLWTQVDDEFKNALAGAVYGDLRSTDGFILDLRDGFGGRPEGYADPFFRPDLEIDWKYGSVVNREKFGYGRPLVVLINRGSRSAKEVLSYILKKSKRATLIGTRTAGNVLGTWPMAIGDWAYLEIPIVDVVTDGVRLENNGVEPDIKVDPEYDESGNDLVLQRAIRFLEQAATKKAA